MGQQIINNGENLGTIRGKLNSNFTELYEKAPGGDGKSAYEIAVDNGFVGTEQAWLASLKGSPGDKGGDGLAATIAVGTVTTGAPGSNAQVVNSGTETAAVLNFTIPRGDPGDGSGSGSGLPSGGTDGQVITKTDGNATWQTPIKTIPYEGLDPVEVEGITERVVTLENTVGTLENTVGTVNEILTARLAGVL